MSNVWVPVLALLGFVLSPFGLYYLIEHKLRPHLKAKRGYLKIYEIMPNGRWRWFYGKPEAVEGGYVIKYKGKTYQYIDDPDFYFYEGNLRCVIYDENGKQVSLKKLNSLVPTINPQLLDSLIERTWNTAKVASLKKADRIEALMWLVLIAVGIAVVASIMTAYKVSDVYNQLLALKSSVHAVKTATTAVKTATTGIAPA